MAERDGVFGRRLVLDELVGAAAGAEIEKRHNFLSVWNGKRKGIQMPPKESATMKWPAARECLLLKGLREPG
jgi:hypothetical protein